MIPLKGEINICDELAKASRDPAAAVYLQKANIGPICPVKVVSTRVCEISCHGLSQVHGAAEKLTIIKTTIINSNTVLIKL